MGSVRGNAQAWQSEPLHEHHEGARYVVVDAIDDSAATFYEHVGFSLIPSAVPESPVPRLARRLDEIADDLAT